MSPGRLERPTYGFEARRSIQLSYGRMGLLQTRCEKTCQEIVRSDPRAREDWLEFRLHLVQLIGRLW